MHDPARYSTGKLRDELLNRELFLHIDELRYVVDRWRMDYNHYRPHSSLNYMSPAAFAARNRLGPQQVELPSDCPNSTSCPNDPGPIRERQKSLGILSQRVVHDYGAGQAVTISNWSNQRRPSLSAVGRNCRNRQTCNAVSECSEEHRRQSSIHGKAG